MRILHWADPHIGKDRDREADALRLLVDHTLRHHPPAHTAIVLCGDVVETPSDQLFARAHDLLAPLKDAGFMLCAVPGNHDVHTMGLDLGRVREATYEGWLRWMAPLVGAHDQAQWPQVWRAGDWQIVGLDTNAGTAHDWGIDLARGGVGQQQLTDLTLLLQDGPSLVFGHHRVWWNDTAHRLEDARALHKILDPRASYYLCGHQHRAYHKLHGGVEYIAAPRTTQLHKGQLRYQIIDLDTRTVRWAHVDQAHASVL